MSTGLRTQKCGRCNAWRTPSQFISNNREVKCCEVCRERSKKYVDKNTDKIMERTKQYYKQNKEQILEKAKQYRTDIENVDKICENQQKYYAKNAEKFKQSQHQRHQENKQNNPLEVKLKTMIRSSKKADKIYNRIYEDKDYVDYDFLLGLWETQTGLCGYDQCKCEMVLTFNLETRNPQQISIQRLDNKIAHIKPNVILSCFECNVCKNMETT